MNYRHAFHAGNFADLLKHAALTELLAALTADPAPLTIIDTHAGAGSYDLAGDLARRTGEAQAGIVRLMADADAPPVFARLKRLVTRANAAGAVRHYPGSPVIIADALRPRDRYLACEIRPDDYAALKGVLPREKGAEALKTDGWAVAAERTPPAPARAFVLIDPPFEADGDYARIAETTAAVLQRNPAAVLAIWEPLKDLTTFDTALGQLEGAMGRAPGLAAQVRLRPLSDPMKMNGCALLVVNPTPGLSAALQSAGAWIAAVLGDAGARSQVTSLND